MLSRLREWGGAISASRRLGKPDTEPERQAILQATFEGCQAKYDKQNFLPRWIVDSVGISRGFLLALLPASPLRGKPFPLTIARFWVTNTLLTEEPL